MMKIRVKVKKEQIPNSPVLKQMHKSVLLKDDAMCAQGELAQSYCRRAKTNFELNAMQVSESFFIFLYDVLPKF